MSKPEEIKAKRLFGRRKGRPLRAGRTALMENLLPRLEIKLPQEEGARLSPHALFDAVPDEVWLEIGFGGGEHLAAQAAANPKVGVLGCEPFVNGVASLLGHVEAQDLKNVRIHPNDARDLLDALPEASLDRCFVLFADPWPKKRHAERRFIGPENLDRLARVLKPGAQLRLATDVMPLAEWMREHACAHQEFACVYDGKEPPADWVPTRYEQKGRAAGREPVYMIFKRR